jgi:ATP/maltotriose-dependent transcriptional regulator MalT
MRHALNEVAFGYQREARQLALSVLSEPSVGDDAAASGALVLAWLGEVARSEAILDELNKRFPHGTLMQSVVLPTVRAKLQLTKGNAERSVELLQASIPYELTTDSFNGCLYPAYVRGEAELARRSGDAAEAEFKKILDHRGLVGNCETVALARLGLAC